MNAARFTPPIGATVRHRYHGGVGRVIAHTTYGGGDAVRVYEDERQQETTWFTSNVDVIDMPATTSTGAALAATEAR